MSALQSLLRRWGFVKLDTYGLALTPEGRVLSTRPGVLDDGTGGRIVGWADGDLAMAELKEWQPTRPAPKQLALAERPAPAPIAITAERPAEPMSSAPPLPQARIVIPPKVPTAPGPVVAPAPAYAQVISESAIMMAVDSAELDEKPPAEEEDWEWTIALARARAEEVDPAIAKPGRAPTSRPSAPRVRPAAQLAAVTPSPAKATAMMSTVASPGRRSSPSPLEAAIQTRLMSAEPTQSFAAMAGDDAPAPAASSAPIPAPVGPQPTARTAGVPPAARPRPATKPPQLFSTSASLPRVAVGTPPSPAPATVIPVPSLPTLAGSAQTQARKLAPVVRSPTAQLPVVAAGRLGKGTTPVGPDAPAEPAEMSDDTQLQINLSVGDRTTPGIAMPMAARAVQLPSAKRRAAERG